jgi:hypothetical protein
MFAPMKELNQQNFPPRFAEYLYLKEHNRTMKQEIQIQASN